MNIEIEATDELIRIGTQVLRLTGRGAKQLAFAIISTYNNQSTKGKMSLNKLLKEYQETFVISVKDEDLKAWRTEARKYALDYHLVKDELDMDSSTILIPSVQSERARKVAENLELKILSEVYLERREASDGLVVSYETLKEIEQNRSALGLTASSNLGQKQKEWSEEEITKKVNEIYNNKYGIESYNKGKTSVIEVFADEDGQTVKTFEGKNSWHEFGEWRDEELSKIRGDLDLLKFEKEQVKSSEDLFSKQYEVEVTHDRINDFEVNAKYKIKTKDGEEVKVFQGDNSTREFNEWRQLKETELALGNNFYKNPTQAQIDLAKKLGINNYEKMNRGEISLALEEAGAEKSLFNKKNEKKPIPLKENGEWDLEKFFLDDEGKDFTSEKKKEFLSRNSLRENRKRNEFKSVSDKLKIFSKDKVGDNKEKILDITKDL